MQFKKEERTLAMANVLKISKYRHFIYYFKNFDYEKVS
jgi:hypothetical protein